MSTGCLPLPPGEPLPRFRAVILGAARALRGDVPPPLVGAGGRGVLDWQLDALGALPDLVVELVVGFRADALLEREPAVRLRLNPRWAQTGPLGSLACAETAAAEALFVCYGDVVFRREAVRRLAAAPGDLVLAVDRAFRERYDGRSPAELDAAEKVRCSAGALAAVGAHVPTEEAEAELAGVIKLDGALAREALPALLAALSADPRAGLPALIEALLGRGVRATLVDLAGDWAELDAPQDLARFVLGTKAESLDRLRPLVRRARIEPQVDFTLAAWRADPAGCLAAARSLAAPRLIVRSSSLQEDAWAASGAGAFRSVLDVPADDEPALRGAVEAVFASYGAPQPEEQVLVQPMLTGVLVSGVVMTRTPGRGAPYVVIDFDAHSHRTDTVTSGTGREVRTLTLHRGAPLRADAPEALRAVLGAVEELEELVGHDSLDVEFAVLAADPAEPRVLQVRPMTALPAERAPGDAAVGDAIAAAARRVYELQRPAPFLVGRRTLLSVMADWNPAEIVGTKPRRLALSLYQRLITGEVWATQRADYGYRDVRPRELLVDLAGHPYVDVRATFNSFVPAELDEPLAERLVDRYLDRLSARPELHDKVEFEVAATCLTCDFDARARELELGSDEREALRAGLRRVTRGGIARCAADLAALERLAARSARLAAVELAPLERAFHHLEEVRRAGALTFAHLARGAFVATALLRSLVRVGALDEAALAALLGSIETVSGELQREGARVARGELPFEALVARFGHLRPGTYDITSPRYDARPEQYLRPLVAVAAEPARGAGSPWSPAVRAEVTRALAPLGLELDADGLEAFARRAIAGRELGKFTFTRDLSAALEALAAFGAEHGLDREALSHVRIEELLALRAAGPEHPGDVLRRLAEAGAQAYAITQAVCLPGLIEGPEDVRCFERRRAAPNFCTQRRVSGKVAVLSSTSPADAPLEGRIAVLPSADPGYDWLFARKLAGLVTLYGGSNSHMAVRAAEFQLPAAIGVGELLYEELCQAAELELDCASQQVRVLRRRGGGACAPSA